MERINITLNGTTYRLDERGFLDPPGQWDESFAEGMAKELGLTEGLSLEHWKVIYHLRKAFLQGRQIPAIFFACVEVKIPLRKMKSLFPMGYLRGACRMAGISFRTFEGYRQKLSYEHIPQTELGRDSGYPDRRYWNPLQN
ncbi:MAG: TusE/DsrC/DsvC family sulfur relay protein [Planctomycetota bacterium]